MKRVIVAWLRELLLSDDEFYDRLYFKIMDGVIDNIERNIIKSTKALGEAGLSKDDKKHHQSLLEESRKLLSAIDKIRWVIWK